MKKKNENKKKKTTKKKPLVGLVLRRHSHYLTSHYHNESQKVRSQKRDRAILRLRCLAHVLAYATLSTTSDLVFANPASKGCALMLTSAIDLDL